jgi:5'-3' exonuclease
MKKILTIIDADSIIFTVAYNLRNKKNKKLVEINVNKFISDVLTNTKASDYIGFFGSKEDGVKPNFRYQIYSKYKEKRPPEPDFIKKWRSDIIRIFKDKWGFNAVEGMEADDAVSICAKYYRADYDEIVIATFDKDLKQIPDSTFYNMKSHTAEYISEFDATYNLCKQMLMGDSSDDIPGLPGVGKAKSAKIIEDCNTKYSLISTVIKSYYDAFKELSKKAHSIYYEKVKEEFDKKTEDPSYVLSDELKIIWDYNDSTSRRERLMRIYYAKEIQKYTEKYMPKGWKEYLKQQYALLHMLEEAPDYFDIPNVVENPNKKILEELSVTKTENELDINSNVNTELIDDLLTI